MDLTPDASFRAVVLQDLMNADPVMGGGAADLLAHVAAKVERTPCLITLAERCDFRLTRRFQLSNTK